VVTFPSTARHFGLLSFVVRNRSASRSAIRRTDFQEEPIMIDQEQECRQHDCDWMQWPLDAGTNDIRQRALAVIAATRKQWTSSASVSPMFDGIGVDSKLLAHPLLRRAFDAMRSGAGRSGAIRARPRRRTE
jgi:hypothetical protein